MESVKFNDISLFDDHEFKTISQELIAEEPLSIQVEGEPYSVIMRTPGKEIFHAAGFCLAEGLVESRDDFTSIAHCPDMDPNVIAVSLESKRREKVESLLKRRGFVSQTSCGICGKELIEDLSQILKPVEGKVELTAAGMQGCVSRLKERQDLYEKTHASHAAMLFDRACNPMAVSEDVGRHNALDKVIGEVFMQGKLSEVVLAVLSSRISYELVQKGARAGIPVIMGLSQPTALAVTLAASMNMTIAGFRKDRLSVFCGKKRIKDGSSG